MVLVCPRRAGQVAGRAVLGGRAEDVAARREQGPLAVGRQGVVPHARGIGVADLVLHLGDADAGAGIVVGDADRDLTQLLARQVQEIKLAALLEGDGVAAQGREVDVVVGETGDLAGLFRVQVIDPDVGAAVLVLVGQVIDLAAVPHGRGVGAGPAGELGQLAAVEVVGEELLGEAAVVALPGAEVPEDAVVGDGVAVRPEGGQAHGAVDRHRDRQAAGDRNLVHVLDPGVPLVLLGQIDHELGIRRPGDHHVVRSVPPAGAGLGGRIVGQPPRLAPRGGDHPDVRAGLAGFGVGDPSAVRRHAREQVLPRSAGQPHRRPAGLGDRPDVAVGHEHDPVRVGLGEPRQGGLGGGGQEQRRRAEQQGRNQAGELHEEPAIRIVRLPYSDAVAARWCLFCNQPAHPAQAPD